MSKGFSRLFSGTSGETARVWNDIIPTQSNYPNTEIPRSFIIKTDGATMWVHGNATEHMAEYIIKESNSGRFKGETKLLSQMMLYDMQQSLTSATRDGILYGKVIHHGNWEFIFKKAKAGEEFDIVIHALIKK